jgi:hypothetical protein
MSLNIEIIHIFTLQNIDTIAKAIFRIQTDFNKFRKNEKT